MSQVKHASQAESIWPWILQQVSLMSVNKHFLKTSLGCDALQETHAFSPHQFISVQSLSHVWLFATPWTAAHQGSVSISNYRSLLKLMPIKPVMPSNHIILCNTLFLLLLVFPRIRVFSNESVLCIRWPKYCSFSFSNSPSNEYSGISFRINWFDLLVQGTLLSLLQHHNSNASILWCSAFFMD